MTPPAKQTGALEPMSWPRLLSAWRLMSVAPHGGSTSDDEDGHRSPFEIDGDRISFTAEWRRAGNKTQVHEPDPAGVPVRSRLTHSNEVSRVGRSLGQMVGRAIIQRHGIGDRVGRDDFGDIVAAAGFAHDLGNPPFGHAGEYAMAEFFGSGAGADLVAQLPRALRAEFANVDGNAQGFRIVTRLTGWRPVGGLQLTAATLATLVKYPFPAVDGKKPWGRRKYGYYAADAPLFREVAEEVGLIETIPGRAWCRHPLVHLLEAADDLCYLVVDVVDATLVGDLSFREAQDLLAPLCREIGPEYREVPGLERKLEYLQSKAIGRLAKDCAQAFLDAEPLILRGQHPGDLLMASPVSQHVDTVARVSRTRIYESAFRQAREVRDAAILQTLLAETGDALVERERTDGLVGGRAAEVLGAVFKRHELASLPTERYGWLRGMVDAVMGMTNARATALALRLRPDLADEFGQAAPPRESRDLEGGVETADPRIR